MKLNPPADLKRCFDGSIPFVPPHSLRRGVATALVLIAAMLGLAACGGSDEGSSGTETLVDALPDDGELGGGWARVTEPRVGETAEALEICGVRLGEGMIDGAKIDLANDREDFVSTFFRRYSNEDAARDAFQDAREKIAMCPPDGVTSGQLARVVTVSTPDDDTTFAALFTFPATDSTLAGEFGWTLALTDDVVRSLTYSPSESRASTQNELRSLATAVATTE